MIRYALRCEPAGHEFDGWFRSIDDFDRQAGRGLVECPVCGVTSVEKGLMRPAVSSGQSQNISRQSAHGQGASGEIAPAEVLAKLQELARDLRSKADYVGPKFAEEARRIHYGEAETRQIYGEASLTEVKGLAEEGIGAMPLPPLPEDKN